MNFVTNEKLTIVGAAGMIGSNRKTYHCWCCRYDRF